MTAPTLILTGVDPMTVESATASMQFDLPTAVVVAHRIDRNTNALLRTVSDISGVLETERIDLDHACPSCAVREDIIPTLARLSELDRWGAIIAQLPIGASALQVCRVCAYESGSEPFDDQAGSDGIRIGGVLAVVDGESALRDLTTGDTLEDRSLPTFRGDNRGVAETLAALIEYADAITVLGDIDPAGADLIDALRRPTSRLTRDWNGLDSATLTGGIHAHVLAEDWVAEVRRGRLPLPQTPHVWTLELSSDRPLDPDRFAAAMEQLCCGTHRIRGCFWLPTRADTVCVMDGAAGQVSIGAHGPWHGRPLNRLVATGIRDGSDADALRAAFEQCQLTDSELAQHGTHWVSLHDGLEPWLGGIHDLA